ncbi:unnamed protein product [Sphagnum balticum]
MAGGSPSLSRRRTRRRSSSVWFYRSHRVGGLIKKLRYKREVLTIAAGETREQRVGCGVRRVRYGGREHLRETLVACVGENADPTCVRHCVAGGQAEGVLVARLCALLDAVHFEVREARDEFARLRVVVERYYAVAFCEKLRT